MRAKALLFVLCIIGALLNTAINLIFLHRTGIPLYLDTILTISMTMMAGPFWGSLTGVLYTLIAHSIAFWGGWKGYLFAICGIATALITWLFIRFFPAELNLFLRQDNKLITQSKSRRLNMIMGKVIALILLSFALCIAMSILGGLIAAFIIYNDPALLEGRYVTGFFASTMFPEGSSLILSEIGSRIPVNIVDRLISVFVGYGIALAALRLVLFRESFLRKKD